MLPARVGQIGPQHCPRFASSRHSIAYFVILFFLPQKVQIPESQARAAVIGRRTWVQPASPHRRILCALIFFQGGCFALRMETSTGRAACNWQA
ncbi:hypothetical protein BC834DRAFT_344205 [Gloeopeniophorella convolvens]|nr:hypothetical protein BC834DRAFT_344205 [Gloeopeniophorella convolvens]